MIKNFVCRDCIKFFVCERVKIISKFHEEAKKPMGIDIEMLTCDEYEMVKKEEDEG